MKRIPALFALFLFLFGGCATTKVDWNSRVGIYTYDDAIAELGVPDRQATLTDGSIVGEWLQYRGGAYGTTHYSRYSRFHMYDVHEFPDRFLRLTFGPDRQLRASTSFTR